MDDLATIGAICREEGLWFHVDGAYGAPAAALEELAPEFAGMSDADYMARNWVNWTELSGDHIVEQHVHNLDVVHRNFTDHVDRVGRNHE